jgi:carbon storage regulator
MECVMLVLTRKQGEKIRIGDDVVITVVRTKGKAVRLGIQAPAHVPVLRGEIAAAIASEGRSTRREGGDGPPDAEADGGDMLNIQLDSRACSAVVGTLSSSTRGPLRELLDARC